MPSASSLKNKQQQVRRQEMQSSLEFRVGAKSVQGAREENQDRMTRFSSPFGEVLAVADGMGGHQGGALAAETVVSTIQGFFQAATPDTPVEQLLQQVVESANEAVHQRSREADPALRQMGSTLVMVLVQTGPAGLTLRLAHVGDSRAYLLRDATLLQVTRDHSVFEELVGMGVSEQEAGEKPNRNHLTRAIGPRPTVDAQLSEPLPVQPGDRILLCSDGLHAFVDPVAIQSILMSGDAPAEAANKLVRAALDGGSDDNISVQVIDFSPESPTRQTVEIPPLARPEPPAGPNLPAGPEPPTGPELPAQPEPAARQGWGGLRRMALLWPIAGVAALGLGFWQWQAASRVTSAPALAEAREPAASPDPQAPAAAGTAGGTAGQSGSKETPAPSGQQPGQPPSSSEPAGEAAGAPAEPARCEVRIVCRGDCEPWKKKAWWNELRKQFPALEEVADKQREKPPWLPELPPAPDIVTSPLEDGLPLELAVDSGHKDASEIASRVETILRNNNVPFAVISRSKQPDSASTPCLTTVTTPRIPRTIP
jgi:serine/threonine protein phosphatase PrpC